MARGGFKLTTVYCLFRTIVVTDPDTDEELRWDALEGIYEQEANARKAKAELKPQIRQHAVIQAWNVQ